MNKPKLILHIGHPKTGTTSLQNYLLKNSSELLKIGYLFPVRYSPSANHVILPAGFLKKEALWKFHSQFYRYLPTFYEGDFRRFWGALLEDIKRHAPHTVILSAEQLFKDYSELSHTSMGDFFKNYFSTVTVVSYVRSPVSDYFSRLAQRIRTGNPIPAPSCRPIREVISFYSSQFPGNVEVHPFDRKQLRGGDILQDFISRYIPPALPAVEGAKTRAFNSSLPWSLLRVLQQIRQIAQPDRESPSISTKARINQAIKDYLHLYPNEPVYKIGLKPEVVEYISRSAIDYLWLREQFGVEFSELDYAQIDTSLTPYASEVSLEKIIDFSNCPEVNFSIERYIDSGVGFNINKSLFYLKLNLQRISGIFLRDSWVRKVYRNISNNFKSNVD